MTVGYMRLAATAGWSRFVKLLFRWRGSVWKSVWKELCGWLYVYCLISIAYRFFIANSQYQDSFVSMVKFIDNFTESIRTTLTFVLGFYVNQIASRWWKVFMEIPWPDSLGLCIAAYYRDRKGGEEEKNEDKVTRTTIIRYVVLAFVLMFRDINEQIRKRFPTLKHLVPYLMTDEEMKMIESEDHKLRIWMPIEWCIILLKKAYKNGQIDEEHYCVVIGKVLDFRTRLNNLLSYDWVNVPLVYSQVVNVVVIMYFSLNLIGKQYLGLNPAVETDARYRCDYAIPVFPIFEFIFYVGWLKVAQVMLNPFGMDDDDFDIDCLIERNLKVGLSMVDNFFDKPPKLIDMEIKVLPHTKASYKDVEKINPMRGSVAGMVIPKSDQVPVTAEAIAKMIEKRRRRNANMNIRKIPQYYAENEPLLFDKHLYSKPLEKPITHEKKDKDKEKEKEKENEKEDEKIKSDEFVPSDRSENEKDEGKGKNGHNSKQKPDDKELPLQNTPPTEEATALPNPPKGPPPTSVKASNEGSKEKNEKKEQQKKSGESRVDIREKKKDSDNSKRVKHSREQSKKDPKDKKTSEQKHVDATPQTSAVNIHEQSAETARNSIERIPDNSKLTPVIPPPAMEQKKLSGSLNLLRTPTDPASLPSNARSGVHNKKKSLPNVANGGGKKSVNRSAERTGPIQKDKESNTQSVSPAVLQAQAIKTAADHETLAYTMSSNSEKFKDGYLKEDNTPAGSQILAPKASPINISASKPADPSPNSKEKK